MGRRKQKYERIKQDIEDAKRMAHGIIEQCEWQRNNLAEWARDSDNRQISSPTASDNTVRLRSLIKAINKTKRSIDEISAQSRREANKKAEFYRRIEEVKDKRYEIETRNNLEGKEDLARESINLIEDVQEWRSEMEEEHTR